MQIKLSESGSKQTYAFMSCFDTLCCYEKRCIITLKVLKETGQEQYLSPCSKHSNLNIIIYVIYPRLISLSLQVKGHFQKVFHVVCLRQLPQDSLILFFFISCKSNIGNQLRCRCLQYKTEEFYLFGLEVHLQFRLCI